VDVRQLVILAFQISLQLTVFGYGLQATLDNVLYLARRPGLLARSFVAMFVAMPIVMIALIQVFTLPHALEVCLVTLALSPVPPAMPKKMIKGGGRHEYAIGLLAIMALLSIVVIPVAVDLIGRYVGRPFAMAPGAIAKVVIVAVIVPLMVGMTVRAARPAIAERIDKPVALIAALLLAVATLVLVGSSWSALWRLATSETLTALTVFVVLGLSIGHVLGGPASDNRVVLALASAGRHPGIALALASANFPEEKFGGIILLYLLVSAILTIPYLKWRQETSAHVMA
jgi:BASS family bile acid:Na+ symporter